MNNRPLKVAVSGIGWCGTEHIKAFLRIEGCQVVKLHGRSRERVRANLERYGLGDLEVAIIEDFQEILDDPEIDIVSIAGINSTHAPYATAAAEKGKHVMIEKPVARDLEELEALVCAITKSGVQSVVSFELYWNPLFKVARWLQESGRMGKTMFVRSNYHSRVGDFYSGWDWCRRKDEARSMLLNAGCHGIDAIRQFTGQAIRQVSAFHTTGWEQGYEYPTTIHVNLEFENGVLGQMSGSADVASPYNFGLEIYGTDLTLFNEYIRWASGKEVNAEELERECPVPNVRFFSEPYSESQRQIRIECIMPNSVNVAHHPFYDQALSLVEAIRTGTPSPLCLETAAISHRIAMAADRSAENRGTPVVL